METDVFIRHYALLLVYARNDDDLHVLVVFLPGCFVFVILFVDMFSIN